MPCSRDGVAWAPPAGVFGNAPRRDGSVRGWPNYNEDLSLFKEFTLKEQLKMRFTVEGGNIFNRTNFTDINGAMTFDATGKQTSTTFGTPRTARTPRVMQASIRINF